MNDNSSYQSITDWDKLVKEVEKIEIDMPDIGFAIEFIKVWNRVKAEGNKNAEKAKRYDDLFDAYNLETRPDWLIVENWRRSHERMKQLDAGEPFMVLLNELREAKAQHRCDGYTLDTNRMHRKEAEKKLEKIHGLLKYPPTPTYYDYGDTQIKELSWYQEDVDDWVKKLKEVLGE